MSNVGWRIKVGHDKYRVIFAKLFRSKEKDAAIREELFLTYLRDLYGHHDGEEREVFPAMIKVPAFRDTCYELEMEHRAMKMLAYELAEMGYDHKTWVYRLAPLYAIHNIHWDKEEKFLIPFAPEHFTNEQIEDLGVKFDAIVAEYNAMSPQEFKAEHLKPSQK
ncbi:MAG: hemerythrin domain-containing protein [Methanomassiliicoccales archaeon]|nr:hemerythrin domain-containing protein [Methanomassiliicoccales archaeon]